MSNYDEIDIFTDAPSSQAPHGYFERLRAQAPRLGCGGMVKITCTDCTDEPLTLQGQLGQASRTWR